MKIVSRDDLVKRLLVLDEAVWRSGLRLPDYERWLENFRGLIYDKEVEELEALYLLTHFILVNDDNVNELLRSAYRDHYLYPRKQLIRSQESWTRDAKRVDAALKSELESTRVVGVGGTAASSAHLLYNFAKVNDLATSQFQEKAALLAELKAGNYPHSKLTLLYIDDLLATGEQVTKQERQKIEEFRAACFSAGIAFRVEYLVLFSTEPGKSNIEKSGMFDSVHEVHLLDAAQLPFRSESRIYKESPSNISIARGQHIAVTYGYRINGQHPTGFGNMGLLIGFGHNVPDNSLPLIWSKGSQALPWTPIFERRV